MGETITKPFEFSTLSKWLHWGSLFLLTVMMVAGLTMTNMEDGDPLKMTIYRLHAVTGLLIILLTLARIVIRLRRPQPTPEGMTEKWNIWLHGIIQWALYLVLLAIGFTGLGNLSLNDMTVLTADPAGMDRTVSSIRGHFVLTRLLLLLVAVHVAGAIRHQLFHSNILRRMGLNLPLGKA